MKKNDYTNNIGQENGDKNVCRRECGYEKCQNQSKRLFFLRFILSLKVKK